MSERFTFNGLDLGTPSWEVQRHNPVFKHAVWVPMTREMALDLAYIPPTDRNPMPRFDLFPRWTSTVRRFKALRHRVNEVWTVALHGIPEPEPADDFGDDW